MPISTTNKLVKFLALFCCSGALLFLFFFPLVSNAAFTKQINYQGKLTNAAGSAVSDSSYTIVFTLYDAPTGGNVVWTETNTVTTQGGLFSLMLGSVSSLDNVNFNQPLYLTLNVNGDGEMTPRKTLGAVASSFTSARLDGNASSTAIDVSGYLSVSGDTTLATTTMSFNSQIGDGSTYLTVEDWDWNGALDEGTPVGSIPLIKFASPEFMYGPNWGGIANGLVIQEYNDDVNPALMFLSKGVEGVNISFATTTEVLRFSGASSYYFNDSLEINGDLEVSDGITLGGVYRTSWPGGAGGTDVNWSYNPLTDILTTATSTSGITVFGTSTLATTTMSFNSQIGDGSTYLTVDSLDLFGGAVPLIKFASPTFEPGGDTNHNYGAMEDGLIVYENLRNPALMFVRKSDNESVNISFATTTNSLVFGGADTYSFYGSGGGETGLFINGSATTTSFAITGLATPAGTFLAVDNNGLVIATTTPTFSDTNDWQIVGGKLTPTSTIDILASANFDVSAGNAYRYNGLDMITASTSLNNYFFGFLAGNLTMTGGDNTANGGYSLHLNTTGYHNTANGSLSLYNNTTGNSNTANGSNSLVSNTTGSYNTADGWGALQSNISGHYNVANGYYSLSSNTIGIGNTALGYYSGLGLNSSLDSRSVSDNYMTFVGFQSSRDGSRVASTTVLTNATAIGYNAKVGSSSAMVLGGTGADAVRVGIGTTTPEAFLDITGTYTSNSLTYGQSALYTFAPTASNDSLQYGSFLNAIATSSAGVNLANVTGSATYVNHYGAGTMTSAYGLATGVLNNGTGIIQDAYGLYLASTTGPVTNSYGIYQAGAGSDNYFEGDINLKAGSIYKYNGVNLAYGSTVAENFFFGGAGNLTMSGTGNTAIGSNSLYDNISGGSNTAIGLRSLFHNISGMANTAIGVDSLQANTSGGYNTANGFDSLYSNTTGQHNTAMGVDSLYSNTTGQHNTAMGVDSLYSNTTGGTNTSFGASSLYHNTEGISNTSVGYNSSYFSTTADNNTVLGYFAFYRNTTGRSNVIIGSQAGINSGATRGDNDSVTDYDSVFIGALSGRDGSKVASTTALNNSVAIGYSAKVGGSNMMALGGTGSYAVNVGIGTSTPQFVLTIGNGSTTQAVKSLQIPYGGLCVDSDGWCTPSTAGRISAVAYTTGSSDLAENYQAFEDNLEAGDIVTMTNINTSQYSNPIDTYGITKARLANAIIGVISTKPGIILGLDNDEALNQNQKPVALSGRVPVKVNLEGGPILPGDAITLSSVAGIGTKATTSGQTIGYALETFDASKLNNASYGQVMVFVNLGYAHLSSSIAGGSINLDELWQLDEVTGEIKATANLNLNNLDLNNVRSITSASGNWGIDEAGNLRVKTVTADNVIVENGVTIKDRLTGTYTCIYVENGAIKTSAGECSDDQNSNSSVVDQGNPEATTSPESLPGEEETGYGTP